MPDATDCDDADGAVHLGCTACLPLAPACTASDELGVCNMNGTFVFPLGDCEFGCDEATATCWPALEVSIAPACHEVALGNGTVIDATVIGGDGVYTFAWTPAATLDDATLEDPTASPTAITEYTVTVTDATGNTAQASTTVHVEDVAWDLSTCELFTFDPTAVTDAAQPDHVFDAGNTEMCNVAESVPSARVCPWAVESFHIEGDFVVDTDEDGDGIGFVWGWQDDHHFYVLSWKQDDDAAAFGNWPMGLIVKRIHADSGGVTAEDLFLASDTANSTLLVGPGDVGVGWVDFEAYTITIDHAFPTTTIEVRRAADDTVVFGGPIVDFEYPRGRFGPFDASQIVSCSGPWTSSCF